MEQRFTGQTSQIIVETISRAMKEGKVRIWDHHSPSKMSQIQVVNSYVIPKMLGMIEGMGLKGFSIEKNHVNAEYYLIFENPLKGGVVVGSQGWEDKFKELQEKVK